MSSNPRPRQASGTSPDDEFVLFIVACIALVTVLGSAGFFWATGLGWLVEHHVLVPAGQHPLLKIPGGDGPGLDGPRIAVVVGAVLAVLAWAVSAVRRAIARRGTIE